ncbi:MAG: flagella assembly protein FlgT middle domain-containing protein [Pseudomonadota bacterium]
MTTACRTFLCALVVLLCAPLHAVTLEAEGLASIKPVGLERARQIAIADAKDRLTIAAGADIEANSIVNPKGANFESSRMRAAVIVGDITIVREWQTGDQLHVRISANVDVSAGAISASHKYKKKIAATPFVSRKSLSTEDIDDIGKGFAAELTRRLEGGGKFLTKRSSYVLPGASSGPSQDSEAVMHLATMYDSQFLVSGDIIDADSVDAGGYFGLFQHKERQLELEFFVYDGLTGNLIARHRVKQTASGEVQVGRDKPFGSAAFLATSFGQAISRAIDAAAMQITRDLENLPFTARVIRVVDERLYIDAGSTSLVSPGDKMVAYRVRKEFPVTGYGSGADYGITETRVATVAVAQVQPLFSICTLPAESKGVKMEVGDMVRFDIVNRQPEAAPGGIF